MARPLTCPVCGTPVVPDARFCFSCGTLLDIGVVADLDSGAERRLVTVLFGDLSDFTAWAEDLDPERVKVVTDRVLTALATAVQGFGGHVDKLTGDGIMAVFGAPTAHEDDAERAVRAAAAMQESVRRLVADEAGGGRQLGLRVGLNTGEVLAGMQAARAYTVVGDTVNTASRLSDAAGIGAVLAGRDTALATLPIASWRALPPLRLKGKREPVPAYELVTLRPRTAARLGLGDEAPLVGREAELGMLVSRLRDATDRQEPSSVLVTGDAGVGKTRLARELARVAGELPGSRVLWGRCAPFGAGRDVAPLVEMLRTVCGITDADDDETARDRVARTIGRLEHPTFGAWSGGLLADRLLALLGLADDTSIAPRDAATPGDAGRPDELAGTLHTLFSTLAREGPLVLVLDDLHWAGDELRDVVAELGRRLRGPVLFVLVGRSEVVDVALGWADALPDPQLLPVSPLEESSAERLLRAYLGGSTLDPQASALILDRAQGNPFFLAELLHLLVDRGLLRREGEQWQLAETLPDGVLPAGVHAVLAARIDDLDAPTKAALRDAAVIGPTFWLPALRAMSGAEEDVVDERLHTLADRGIVQHGPGGSWVFAHTLTREVAYAGVPKADRARRHAAVAAWAAQHHPGPPTDVDEFVSTQGERAVRLAQEMALPPGDVAWSAAGLAATALLRLGEVSLRHDDNPLAVDLLGRGFALAELPGVPPPPGEARVSYALALAGLHRLDEALAQITPVLGATDPLLRAGALVALGDVRRKQGADDEATAAFVQALTAASDAGDERLAGEAIRQLGLLDYFAGRLRDAESRFRQAVELAERAGDDRGLGWALQHLGWSATSRGDYDLADEALQRASAVFLEFGDFGGAGWCAGTTGFVRLLQGRLHEARELARGVRPMAEESGDSWGIAACLVIDAIASAELGDISSARECARAALALYEGIADAWGRAISLIASALAERGAGNGDLAIEQLLAAVAMGEEQNAPLARGVGLVFLAWCHYDDRNLDAAERTADAALDVAQELGLAAHAEIGTRVLIALVHRARGDLETALKILGEIADSPQQPTLLFPMRQAMAHYAGTLLDSGRADEAVAVAERALTVPAEDVRSRVIALRALGAARAAAGDLEGGEAALRAALAASEETEQRLERDTTERVLADFLTSSR